MADLSKSQKVGVGVAVVLAIAIVLLIMFWPRSSSAATAKTIAPVVAEPLPVAAGPDPYNPTTTPTPGKYYVPVKGDGEVKIVQKAGLLPVARAASVIRKHKNNEWIPQTSMYGTPQLDLDWGYAAMSGVNTSKPWAYKTAHIASGGYKICVVYVPTQAEVDA